MTLLFELMPALNDFILTNSEIWLVPRSRDESKKVFGETQHSQSVTVWRINRTFRSCLEGLRPWQITFSSSFYSQLLFCSSFSSWETTTENDHFFCLYSAFENISSLFHFPNTCRPHGSFLNFLIRELILFCSECLFFCFVSNLEIRLCFSISQ